ncbi:restriction endonuclease subunit S [Vibrio cholerae]|uniref:restriction endonuclease subunit S n=1 Tax=Vibrio cholerae TaxID=666 RepID=UPI00155DF37C|nr:restriction endonuclease subunit S [Vibrio cholerae]NOE77830.1 restriction endonuclease subunit S [Vibrio cholerae]
MGKYYGYQAYKKREGAEWLGDIPEHWQTLRGKYVFKEVNERSESGDETLLSVSEYYGVKPRAEKIADGEHLSRAESLVGYKKCEVNDLVMNIMLAWKRGQGVSKYKGIVSPAYSVFRFFDNANPDFMHYLFRTDLYTGHFKTRSTGVIDSRLRLYPESFFDVDILLPTLGEQTQIANFLDHETAKIDTLIEKQQQLIKLLKEKREAVISHAVSAKDGERSAKLSYFTDLLSGYAFPSSGFKQEPSDAIPLLRGINVGVGHIKWNETVYWPASDAPKLKEFVLEEGDIVFGMDRPWISSGARVAEVKNSDLPCFLLQRVARIRSLEGTYQPFVKLCLASNEFKRFVEADLTGVSVPHISPEQIKSFPIRAIGYEKQKYVTDLALANCQKLDEIEKKAEKAINLMQERRTALISAAVTGKIDVRNWQAPISQDQALEQTA